MVLQIFHLADIHIRKGNYVESRFLEYANVFEACIEKIRGLYRPNESLTVICGDLFHHKLQISSHGIVLFYKLIHALADMMPVIIIQGNHDLLQENDDENNDLIKALLSNHPHENVHYCDKTTGFDWNEDIHIGLVSIRDMLQKCSSSGMVDDLPMFPPAKKAKLNIAMSHATIKNCLLHNYTKATSGVPLEWFKGYDLVLLGDVHLQSAKFSRKNNVYYGYPGSLVQQDFGEGMFYHGFLLWNLDKTKVIGVEKHHVHNPFGRANLRMIDDVICINIDGSGYESLYEVLQKYELPKEIHARLYCKENTVVSDVRDQIESMTSKANITMKVDIITTSMNDDNETSCDTAGILNSSIHALTSTETIIEFFKSNGNDSILNESQEWESYFRNMNNIKLSNTLNGVSEHIDTLIASKNIKLDKKIEGYGASSANLHSVHNTLRILNIKFDWLLAFGRKNCFNFSNNKITLINAPNGYGKSAFFECIMLGLFGETIPSRHNRSNTISILNKRKPANVESSLVSITFMLNNLNTYVLNRDFHEYTDSRNKNIKRLHSNKVELYENGDLIKTGARLINTWVNEHVCTSQDFLLSTMITQNFDYDFFKLKSSEQNELLDSVLNMTTINNMCDVIKEAKKEYRDLKNHMDTFAGAKRPRQPFNDDEYTKLLQELDDLDEQLSLTKKEYDSLNILPAKQLASDLLDEPNESLDTILTHESELIKELNILEVDHDETPQSFDLHDLTMDQFLTFEGSDAVKPCTQTIKKLVLQYKTRTIKDLVIKFREACDALNYCRLNLENVKSAKPQETTEHTIEEYHEINLEYEAYKKKYAKVKVVDEPTFDLNFEKPNCADDLFELSQDKLEELSKQVPKEHSSNYVHNPECWACVQNFGSQQSNDAKAVLEYNRKCELKHEWLKYQKKKSYVERLQHLGKQYEEIKNALPLIKQHMKWTSQLQESEDAMKIKLQEKINIGLAIQEVFVYQTKCNTACKALIELEKVKQKKLYYTNRKLSLKLRIEQLNKRILDFKVKIGQMEVAQKEHHEYAIVKDKLCEIEDTLSKKIGLFTYFIETFGKYKSWVYNQKVLPAIVNKTNFILRTLFQNRELVLMFTLGDNDILFTVKDEGNIVNMEKLSGAQSFAVSLSFRLALSAVGITRFRCNQLFIDEGFCSFDQHNLLNVPVLIKNLKQLYDEIILVTHLEEIKSCADAVVNIQRNNGVSSIVH